MSHHVEVRPLAAGRLPTYRGLTGSVTLTNETPFERQYRMYSLLSRVSVQYHMLDEPPPPSADCGRKLSSSTFLHGYWSTLPSTQALGAPAMRSPLRQVGSYWRSSSLCSALPSGELGSCAETGGLATASSASAV